MGRRIENPLGGEHRRPPIFGDAGPIPRTIEKHRPAEHRCLGKISASSWQVFGMSWYFGVWPGNPRALLILARCSPSNFPDHHVSIEKIPAQAMLLEPSSLLIWPTQFTIEKHFLAEPSCPGKVSASSWQVLGISLLFGVRPGHFLAQGPPQTLPEPSPNPPKSSLEPSKTQF